MGLTITSYEEKKPGTILFLSYVISVLIIITSLVGIFGSETYINETKIWKIQSIGQDKINLMMIVPVLLLSGFKAYRQNTHYLFVFGGSLLFLIYTFIIYCFTVHFNSLFIVYCTLLGISFYSFIYVFIQSYLKLKNQLTFVHLPVKSLRGFLWIIALSFSFLWLREDVVSILLGVPSVSLKEAGLFTNPVHVLDLAIVLPGFIITAHLLKKGVNGAKLLVPYILAFSVLMFINIGALWVMENISKPPFQIGVIVWVLLPVAIGIFLFGMISRRFTVSDR